MHKFLKINHNEHTYKSLFEKIVRIFYIHRIDNIITNNIVLLKQDYIINKLYKKIYDAELSIYFKEHEFKTKMLGIINNTFLKKYNEKSYIAIDKFNKIFKYIIYNVCIKDGINNCLNLFFNKTQKLFNTKLNINENITNALHTLKYIYNNSLRKFKILNRKSLKNFSFIIQNAFIKKLCDQKQIECNEKLKTAKDYCDYINLLLEYNFPLKKNRICFIY